VFILLEHLMLAVQGQVSANVEDVPASVQTLAARFDWIGKKVFMNLEQEVSTVTHSPIRLCTHTRNRSLTDSTKELEIYQGYS
jgi:hypothetical protein